MTAARGMVVFAYLLGFAFLAAGIAESERERARAEYIRHCAALELACLRTGRDLPCEQADLCRQDLQ